MEDFNLLLALARGDMWETNMRDVAAILRAFYLAPISASSLQPVLELAVLLNPDLLPQPAPDQHLGATEAV